MKALDFIQDNWEEIGGIIFYLLLITKIIVNMIPTNKNKDIILRIIEAIDSLFPNKSTHGEKHIIKKDKSKL